MGSSAAQSTPIIVLKTLNGKVHILPIPLRFRVLREGRGFERCAVRAHFVFKEVGSSAAVRQSAPILYIKEKVLNSANR